MSNIKNIADILPEGLDESTVEQIFQLVDSTINEQVAEKIGLLEARVTAYIRTKIDDLKEQALTGTIHPFAGSDTICRDFIYVGDICKIISKFIKAPNNYNSQELIKYLNLWSKIYIRFIAIENNPKVKPLKTLSENLANLSTLLLKVIEDKFEVINGHLETIHAYTNDQNLVDNMHSKHRRGRAAALNMVITETGAGKAVAKALPALAGKLMQKANKIYWLIPLISLTCWLFIYYSIDNTIFTRRVIVH